MAPLKLPLQVACPNCQTGNLPGAPYCSRCGAPLGEKVAPPSAAPQPPTPETLKPFLNEGQDATLVKLAFDKALQIMTSGEAVEYIATTVKIGVGATPEAIIATDKRVLVYKKKMLGKVELDDCFWRDVRDADVTDGKHGVTLTLETIQGWKLTVEGLPKAQAWRLYSVVGAHCERIRDRLQAGTAPSELLNPHADGRPPSTPLSQSDVKHPSGALDTTGGLNTSSLGRMMASAAMQSGQLQATGPMPNGHSEPEHLPAPMPTPQTVLQNILRSSQAPAEAAAFQAAPQPEAQPVVFGQPPPYNGQQVQNQAMSLHTGSLETSFLAHNQPGNNGFEPYRVAQSGPLPQGPTQAAYTQNSTPMFNGSGTQLSGSLSGRIPARPSEPASTTAAGQAAPIDDPVAKMKQLRDMLEAGLITASDYEIKKNEILSRI